MFGLFERNKLPKIIRQLDKASVDLQAHAQRSHEKTVALRVAADRHYETAQRSQTIADNLAKLTS